MNIAATGKLQWNSKSKFFTQAKTWSLPMSWIHQFCVGERQTDRLQQTLVWNIFCALRPGLRDPPERTHASQRTRLHGTKFSWIKKTATEALETETYKKQQAFMYIWGFSVFKCKAVNREEDEELLKTHPLKQWRSKFQIATWPLCKLYLEYSYHIER